MASDPIPRLYSVDEYLPFERRSLERHQYLDGKIRLMPSDNLATSTIYCNLAANIGVQLRGGNCRAFSPNMRIRGGPTFFTYADATVVCGEPRFHDEHRDVLLNPKVIFEVLSPSTEAFDRGDKFRRYAAHLESLEDYVLISSEKPVVEHFRRHGDGQWIYTAVEGLEASLVIESIGCRLLLEELYQRVEFRMADTLPNPGPAA